MIVCVPTPLTGAREPDLTYLLDAAASLSAGPAARSSSSSSSRPPTPAPPASGCCRSSRSRGWRRGATSTSPSRRSGSTRAAPTTPSAPRRSWSAASPRPAPSAPASSTRRSATRWSSSPTPETAELAKLLENIFRSVNIAFVNELAQLCDRLGIDVWEVIDAASTKPFGFMRFDPGPGMGGHCLPVDPFYLAFKAREHDFYPEFIELAGKVNQAQPAFCVERIERALNEAGKPVNGSKILDPRRQLQGRRGGHRESPALKIVELLRELGGEVSYHDPHVPELPELGPQLGRPRRRPGRHRPRGDRHRPPQLDYERVVSSAAAGDRLPRRHPRHRGREPRQPLGGSRGARPPDRVRPSPTGLICQDDRDRDDERQTRPDDRSRWLALYVLCAGMLMIVLDATVVNVALPTIQDDLGFSQSNLAWVVNAYLIAFGGLLLLAGRHRRPDRPAAHLPRRPRRLHRRLAALRGSPQSQGMLIGARFIQGVGGALTSAVILGMIVTMFPRAAGAGEGDRRLRLRRLRRRLDRPARRRRPDPGDQLALDLLHQPADRDRRPRSSRCGWSRTRTGIGLSEGADIPGAVLITGGADARRLHDPRGHRARLGLDPDARRSAPSRSPCSPRSSSARRGSRTR